MSFCDILQQGQKSQVQGCKWSLLAGEVILSLQCPCRLIPQPKALRCFQKWMSVGGQAFKSNLCTQSCEEHPVHSWCSIKDFLTTVNQLIIICLLFAILRTWNSGVHSHGDLNLGPYLVNNFLWSKFWAQFGSHDIAEKIPKSFLSATATHPFQSS